MSIQQYVQRLQQGAPEAQDKIAQEFSRLTHHQIRAIVQGTNLIVRKLNEELNCFCMQVSTQGLQILFLVAQTFTNALATNLELVYVRQPLLSIAQRKQAEQLAFVAKLTQNEPEMDAALAQKFAHEMLQHFHKKAKDFSIQEFKDNINSVKDKFYKLFIFNDMENRCKQLANKRLDAKHQDSEADKQLIKQACEMYKNPKVYLE